MRIVSNRDFPKSFDADPVEIWNYSQPQTGDHIRVCRGLYNHHGIYIADEEVIHFTGTDDDNILDWAKNEVIKTNLHDFLRGGRLEVKEYTDQELKDLYPVEHITLYARACLGDKSYNLIFNNCEHFANTCTLGRFKSRQVERFFDIVIGDDMIKLERKNEMGLFGTIGGIIKGWFGGGSSGGSRSTSNTNYEPDKVKVAEIEADTKLRLAGMENERIELMKNAKLELLEFETKSKLALEEARARGLYNMAQTIIAVQDKLTEVAERRLQIIENGSIQIVKEIETFYQELGKKIEEDDDTYNTEKLPQLLALLERYEIGTPAHSLYQRRIEDDMALQSKHYTMQLNAVVQRQSQIISGFLQSKDRVVEHTSQLTEGLLERIAVQIEAGKNESVELRQPLLSESKMSMIGDGK